MINSSRNDNLVDHYRAILKRKSSTIYERAAAIGFAALTKRAGTVIHRFELIGASNEVPHQIYIELGEAAGAHVLIECLDFNVKGGDIGVAAVRTFLASVKAVHADLAYIVTCNNATDEAKKYAQSHRIFVSTARFLQEPDWEKQLKAALRVRVQRHNTEQAKRQRVLDRQERRDYPFLFKERSSHK